ncbi:SDR family NAD(P)-dependent oxidoreductase [Lacticaseibacillus saniviri]|uniref:SDR family NAD(P)-dependent oxidoreductase n=1 Tax=Lacticaseibacillus saniviri TaxID=931533 RepID=UPI000AB64B7D|nr:SDR family NAD(P)-dependent oxidoreductase [Lacticaseibacillus saniviri]
MTIVIASRNNERMSQAVERLKAETNNRNIYGIRIDVSSLQSVREFVNHFKNAELPPLYGIVANAGAQFTEEVITEDGFEGTFATNYLGHFLLIQLLLPLIADNGRIIMVSSDTHDPAVKTMMPAPVYTDPSILADQKMSYEMLRKYSAFKRSGIRYTTSKLAIIYFVHELSRKLIEAGRNDIVVDSFNPGLMVGNGSNLARDYNPVVKYMWNHMAFIIPHLHYFDKHTIRSVTISGRDLAELMLTSSNAVQSGQYWDGDRMIPSSPESYNRDREARLWQWSLKVTNLREW